MHVINKMCKVHKLLCMAFVCVRDRLPRGVNGIILHVMDCLARRQPITGSILSLQGFVLLWTFICLLISHTFWWDYIKSAEVYDDGTSIECCHDDNCVLCRHEHWHWFLCLSLDLCCSIPVCIVYRRRCLPLVAYCPLLCLFWHQMWECILSTWICGLFSVQTVRWRCWVDGTLLVALNQCIQSCWCWVIWITYRRHLHLIERYHQRATLNIHWSDFVTNIEVLEMAKVTSIEAMLLKTQQRLYYNIYGELFTGHRDKGTPQKIYKVTLKRFLASCNINYRQRTTQATNRMN